MCIAAFAFGLPSSYRLVFAANRDELHARPTAAAEWWPDEPTILGGRDLIAGGTWLAIDRAGRLAAVTNLPVDRPLEHARSRGTLVRDFLSADGSAADFVAGFEARSAQFGPCNLLAWDGTELHYAGTGIEPVCLAPGLHALGNAPLGADWPRARRAQDILRESLAADDPAAALLERLGDGADRMPDSADAALARRRTEIFVRDPYYGTRSSTVVLVSSGGHARFVERSFAADGRPVGERVYEFTLAA